jgi:DNA-binding CsgD family transcriptional regulator
MRSRVIGRDREIEAANRLLSATAETRKLLLVGEAGIGKTTIWGAIVDEAAERGFSTLTASPSEAEAELPFAVLTDLFARVDPSTLDRLPEPQCTALEQALRRRRSSRNIDPTAVALGTLGVLRLLADEGPSLVAIDDLQWVDAPSMRALSFALRRVGDARITLVASVRAGFDSVLASTAAADAAASTRIELTGLESRHLAQLVLERTGRALSPAQLRELARLSGGNPFYALELAATGEAQLAAPESLAAALRIRLSALRDDTRRTALTVATLGRVDEPVIRRLHGPGLDELRSAGLVDDVHGALWFVHPLLASTVLEMYTDDERRAVHLALATALEDPDERALHLGRGTDTASEAVAAELEQAAARVDARGAPETAARLAERAAELTPDDDVAATTRRLLAASDLYQVAGEGRDHVRPLLERLASSLPAGPDRARALVRLGWLGAQMDTISTAEAVAYQERALQEAGGAGDVEVAAHAVLARMRGTGGDYRSALRHGERAVSAVSGTIPNLMFPSPHGELGIARFLTGHGLDEQLFLEGIEAESQGLEWEPYQGVRLRFALALLYAGDTSRSRALLHELLERSRALDRVRSVAGCHLHLVELEVRSGDLAQAEEHATEFAYLDLQLRGELGREWYPSGLVASHLGRAGDARRILQDGVAYSREIGSAIWLAHHLGALGHLELSAGDLEAAREALAEVPALLRTAGLGEWSVHPFHPDAIETLVGLGEVEEAGALTEELEEYGRRLDRPWGVATACRSWALIASARGADDDALAAAEEALATHERFDWPLEKARTLLVTGVVLRRVGRRRDAATVLDEARVILTALRNPLWLAKVEAEAGRLGGRRGSGDELTPTEERVAELAAAGLRNVEIAARLHVTPKTVEATLSRVYRKLGVRSRTELAHRAAAAE